MQAWFWLLLPLAAASGWWAAQYSQKKRHASSKAVLNSAYGQGLNYLLNEEPDKATEVLVRMVEVDPDTVELHLALGSLFRRRGETDRAIRVHQNIIARSRLSAPLRAQATLELGRDFLRAGLLDRAEKLFLRLLDDSRLSGDACQHLVDLYQQEQEWRQAIASAERLAAGEPETWKPRIAQYYCELGETALQRQDTAEASALAQTALEQDAGCVRATLLKAQCLRRAGELHAAIDAWMTVEQQNSALLPEVLGEIRSCFEQAGETAAWEDYASGLMQRHAQLSGSRDSILESPVQSSLDRRTRYCCDRCGFSSRKLFWQCPGCRCWSSVKPIQAGSET